MKIVVYVEGGVVQEVRASHKEVEVEVFDVDNLKETDTRAQIDEAWDKLTDACPHAIL